MLIPSFIKKVNVFKLFVYLCIFTFFDNPRMEDVFYLSHLELCTYTWRWQFHFETCSVRYLATEIGTVRRDITILLKYFYPTHWMKVYASAVVGGVWRRNRLCRVSGGADSVPQHDNTCAHQWAEGPDLLALLANDPWYPVRQGHPPLGQAHRLVVVSPPLQEFYSLAFLIIRFRKLSKFVVSSPLNVKPSDKDIFKNSLKTIKSIILLNFRQLYLTDSK